MAYFKETIIFQGSRGVGTEHFSGVPTFSKGVQLLIPIATYRICDFPGGGWSGHPDPILVSPFWISACYQLQVN